MPTIEIVCINQHEPIKFDGLPFGIRSERTLISHRGLFQDDFAQLSGCIYHLGNPDLRNADDFIFFAYELVEEAMSEIDGDFLKFNAEFAPHIRSIFDRLLRSSPINKVTFSSDWQFGPDKAERFETIPIKEFWSMHDSNQLRFNALYKIELS